MVEDRPIVTTVRLIGSHRYPIDRFQFRVILKGGMRRAQFSRQMTFKRTWRFFEIIDIISNIIIGKKSKKFDMCAIDAACGQQIPVLKIPVLKYQIPVLKTATSRRLGL